MDATAFLTAPCDVLSADQLKGISLPTSGKADTDSVFAHTSGPGCSWANDDKNLASSVDFMTGNKNGLADTYRGHEQGFFPLWEPTVIAGYPAVFSDAADVRQEGTCALITAISDTLTFLVNEQDVELGPRSCDRAKQVASMVIDTLKAGH